MMIDKKDCLTHLKRFYEDVNHPLYLSGITKIYEYYNGTLPVEDIEKFLQTKDTYTLHRQVKRPIRNPTYVYYKRYQFQCDLVHINSIKKWNNNYSYLMTCIDIFTRKAFVRLLKTKHATEATKEMLEILHEAVDPPKTILFDR